MIDADRIERAFLPPRHCRCGQQMTLRTVPNGTDYSMDMIWRCQGCGQEDPAWFAMEPRPPGWNCKVNW